MSGGAWNGFWWKLGEENALRARQKIERSAPAPARNPTKRDLVLRRITPADEPNHHLYSEDYREAIRLDAYPGGALIVGSFFIAPTNTLIGGDAQSIIVTGSLTKHAGAAPVIETASHGRFAVTAIDGRPVEIWEAPAG